MTSEHGAEPGRLRPRRGEPDAAIRQALVDGDRHGRFAAFLPHPQMVVCVQAQPLIQRRIHRRDGRRRIARFLQRRRAAHQRIRRNRSAHRRCAAGRRAGQRPRSERRNPDAVVQLRGEVLCAERFAAHVSALSCSKPGRPSRLPSTRSTFHAGRASPSGCTQPVKLCDRAFGVDERARGFAERTDRQHDVRVIERAMLERAHRDDELGLLERRERARGSCVSSSASTPSSK